MFPQPALLSSHTKGFLEKGHLHLSVYCYLLSFTSLWLPVHSLSSVLESRSLLVQKDWNLSLMNIDYSFKGNGSNSEMSQFQCQNGDSERTASTHCGLVMWCHWVWSTLVQVINWCWTGTKTLDKPMLIYCHLDSLELHSANTNIFSKKLLLKMVAILFMSQCVYPQRAKRSCSTLKTPTQKIALRSSMQYCHSHAKWQKQDSKHEPSWHSVQICFLSWP